MTDATPPRAQRKRVWARLSAEADRMVWHEPDAFARGNGWEIRKTAWGGREYRDPRFDRLAPEWAKRREPTEGGDDFAETLANQDSDSQGPAWSGSGGSGRPPGGFIAGDGFPRNHPRIPPAKGLVALIGLLWRWRIEVAAVGIAAVAASGLVQWLGPMTAAALGGAVILAGAAIPPLRRALGRLVIRHRFQGLCRRTSLRTLKGRLPLIMSTSATDGGILLLIWCRSGMSPELFEAYIPEIKVACFASEVFVFPHYRWPHLLTLELRRV